MSTGAAPKETLPGIADHKPTIVNLATATQLTAGALLLGGVAQIIIGPLGWLWLESAFVNSVAALLQGALMAFLGLVMLAVSSDFKFLGDYPQYGGNHLRNAAKSLQVFHKAQAGLAVLIGLIVLIRLL